MAYRIDRVRVQVEGVQEFEGRQDIAFDIPPDDPLAAYLLAWNNARLRADAIADSGQAEIPGFG